MPLADVDPLELGQILGSLLSALVDAEKHAARTSVEFLGDVGLVRDEETQVDRLRMVKFTYRKKDENGRLADFEAEIPMLAMVSVPTLAVKKASIAFSYDVLVAQSVSEGPQPITGALRPALLQGYVRRTGTGESESRTSIDVHVTIERGELPLGIERALDLAELSIRDTKAPPPPPPPEEPEQPVQAVVERRPVAEASPKARRATTSTPPARKPRPKPPRPPRPRKAES